MGSCRASCDWLLGQLSGETGGREGSSGEQTGDRSASKMAGGRQGVATMRRRLAGEIAGRQPSRYGQDTVVGGKRRSLAGDGLSRRLHAAVYPGGRSGPSCFTSGAGVRRRWGVAWRASHVRQAVMSRGGASSVTFILLFSSIIIGGGGRRWMCSIGRRKRMFTIAL